MPSAARPLTPLALALALGLSTASLSGYGLENGEVAANAQFRIGGATTDADSILVMSAIAPDPFAVPPLPSHFAPARALLDGSMSSSINHATTASTSSALNQFSSSAQSLVDFVDNLIVEAEGVPAGTELIVEVAWQISGNTELNAPGRVLSRTKLVAEAEGIDRDPDPDAPPPPRQTWTRDFSNYSAPVLDDFGQVTFEFLVQAGTPGPGNIRLRTGTGVLVGDAGSFFTGVYDSDATSELEVSFVGATNVKTKDGQTLFRWQTNAASRLEYGSRDDDPPDPTLLTTGPSSAGVNFDELSWNSKVGRYYIVETTTDGTNWNAFTEVLGTEGDIRIDVIRNPKVTQYRLVELIGNGRPNPTLQSPTLHVLRVIDNGLKVRLAWMSNHWEIYQLNEVLPDGSLSPAFAHLGDGGAVWFDIPPTGSGRVFQVTAISK